MRLISKIFVSGILLSVATTFVSCSSYDDTAIKDQIQDLDKRLSKVEKQIEQINDDIGSYLATVNALKNNDWIESVSQLEDGSGYKIVFSKHGEITIVNGANGKTGDNGHSPSIGVKEDSDGKYYWTVDGEFLLDESGNKISATAMVETPAVRLSTDGKHYEISFDGGASWKVVGDVVSEESVNTIFSNVSDDGDIVTFFLTEGGTIRIPKAQQFALNIDNTQIGIKAGQTLEIGYTITAGDEGTIVDGIAENGYSVSVSGNVYAGTISVTAPDPLVNGKAIIIAVNSKGVTSARILNFEEGQLMLIADGTSVDSNENTITIMVMTNLSYRVNIPSEATSWISLIETKALQSNLLTFKIEKNNGAARKAKVSLVDNIGTELQSFEVKQAAGESSSDEPGYYNSIRDWEKDDTIKF